MKIIQILMAPNNSGWQGRLLGLTDTGAVYWLNSEGNWDICIPPIVETKEKEEYLPS